MHRLLCLVALLPAWSFAAVITVNEPWMRPAAKGASTDVFMELTVSERAAIVDIRTPAAAKIAVAKGSRRVAPPFPVDLVAQETLLMRDAGTHIVLSGLARALKRGDRVPLTLVLAYADGTTQDIEVDAEVRRRSPSEDHGVHRH